MARQDDEEDGVRWRVEAEALQAALLGYHPPVMLFT